jgi:uncharacterized membrane protein
MGGLIRMRTQQKGKNRIRAVCYCALLSALTFALTFINIRLPLPGSGGLVHLGNIPVVVAAVILGRKYSAAAGAVGMTLFDIAGGWVVWAPFTLVIRLASGFITGWFAEKKRGESVVFNLIGVLAGGVVLVAGYYLAELILYGNPVAPLASIPGNLLQVATAVFIGLPLAAAPGKRLRQTLRPPRA